MQNSDYIAIASAIVAALALGLTFWQGWLTRKHNHLSVRPLLTWHVSRLNTASGSEVIFILKNKGIGPAIITKRQLTLNGEIFIRSGHPSDEVLELVKHVLGNKFNYIVKTYGLPGIGNAILPGEEFVIAHVAFSQMSHDGLTKVLEESEEINVLVDYESLYGQKSQMRTNGNSAPIAHQGK